MRYCYFSAYDNMHQRKKYTVPILCNSLIYGAMDTTQPNTRVLWKESSTFSVDPNGFDDPKVMANYISMCMDFNPVTTGTDTYLTNTNAVSDGNIIKYLSAFEGKYDEFNEDGAFVYPNEQSGTVVVGYNYLGTNAGTAKRSTNSFWGPYQPGGDLACSAVEIPVAGQHPNEIMIEHSLRIHPDSFIQSGKFDFDVFYDATGGRKWLCFVVIQVVYSTTTGKWTFKIYLIANDIDVSNYKAKLQGYEPEKIYNPNNPNEQPPDNGGPGGFDDSSDPIDIPEVPDLDISALGAVQVYKVSTQTVKDFLSYLHSHEPGESILKWWTNPIQGVIALFCVPWPVHNTAGQSIKILGMDTGCAGGLAPPFERWDNLGSYHFDTKSYTNSFMDYEPYTKIQIYLPYIGMRQLDPDEVMGKTLKVHYMMDNTSGTCIAYLEIGGSVRYTYSGNGATQIPLSQENWGQTYISAATTAASAVGGMVSGAASALAGSTGGLASTAANTAGGAIAGGVNAAGGMGAITGLSKPTVSRSGSISGSAGMMSVRDIYVVMERPNPIDDSYFSQVVGYPSGRGVQLGSLSGYNIIEHCHLSGIPATGPELDEIESLLHQGVIF